MNEAAALLELQAKDVEIMRANKRLEELPEKRAILELRAKQREVSEMRGKGDQLLRKLEAELKARQDEITMINEKLAAEQTKIMETTDHRMVQSITREMDALRRRTDKLEMESMGYMERVEKANSQVAAIDEALKTLADKEQELIGHYQEAGGRLQAEIGDLQKQRKKAAKAVSAPMLKRYESLREAKSGIGVGQLNDETCSACRMALPAEKRRDLHAGDDIGICPQCGRLLVVRTGEEKE